MSAIVINLVGIGDLVVLIAVPALLVVASSRSAGPSKLPTVLALTVLLFATLALAGVWFVVAVAAHKVDPSLTTSWIVANASYPVIGVAMVLIHRRLLR